MGYLPLLVLLAVLMIDAVIEVGFVGSMVGFLHHDHGGVPYTIAGPKGKFTLAPKPAQPIVDQGHTSNGAAGTALILVGVIGYIVIFRQKKRERLNTPSRPSKIFLTWTAFTIISFLLTLSALIYTYVVTNQTDNQTISLTVAAANQGSAYPDLKWTPENWYRQVLTLPFADPSEKNDIRTNYHLMRGWRYNLIPLLILGLAVCCLATWHTIRDRRGMASSIAYHEVTTFSVRAG